MSQAGAASTRARTASARIRGARVSDAADARERLLRAGIEIVRVQGLRRMSVRAVAQAARANLGSFVYHFGTREAFVDELIERWYGPMFESLRLTASQSSDPLAALRRSVLQLVRWLVDNRSFVAALLLDAAAGERGAQRFLRNLEGRHPALLLELLQRAQRAGHLLRDDPRHQLLFIMGSLAPPVIAAELATRAGRALPPLARSLAALGVSPRRLEQRLDWALRGLAPAGGSP